MMNLRVSKFVRMVERLEDPVAGLFMAISEDGRIWKKQITAGGMPVWNLWQGDPVELALTGQQLELDMVLALMEQRPGKRTEAQAHRASCPPEH